MKIIFNKVKNHPQQTCHTNLRRDAHEPACVPSQNMFRHIIPSGCHRVHHLFLYRLYSCGVHRDSIALVRGHPELGFQMGTLISIYGRMKRLANTNIQQKWSREPHPIFRVRIKQSLSRSMLVIRHTLSVEILRFFRWYSPDLSEPSDQYLHYFVFFAQLF